MHTPDSRRAATRAAAPALATLAALAALFFYAHGRAAGATYYSRGSLPPELPASWSATRDGLGAPPAGFAGGDAFVIQNGHDMSTAAGWSVSGAGAKVQVESGGTLTANNLVAVPNFQIDDGGAYIHNAAGSGSNGSSNDIPGAASRTFAAGSSVTIQRWANGGTVPTGLPAGVVWGNLTINVAALAGSWNQSGGLNTVNGDLTVRATGGREFRLAAGTPAATTLKVGGNLVISGGTVNLSSGAAVPTVNLSGGYAQTGGTLTSTGAGVGSVNFKGGPPFVTFQKTAGTLNAANINWSIAAGKAVEFDSAFTNAAARTLAVEQGGALLAAAAVVNNGALAVDGEFRLTAGGSAAGNGFVYGASSLLSYDTGSAYTAGVEFPASGVRNLALAATTQLALDGDKTVAGSVSLGAGKVATGSAHTLTLGGSAALTRTSGYVVGALKKVAVPAGFTFHVGTAAGYTPLEVSNASGGGDLSVRAVGAAHPSVNASTALKEYWRLGATGPLTADLTFNYLQSDVQGNESGYRVVRVTNGSAGSFPQSCPSGPCVDAASNTAVVRAVSTFSDWTLDEPGPLTLARLAGFRATETEGGTVLEWKTGYEVENLGFNLYREAAGRLTPVNASLIAGSALVAGPGVALTAGNSYSWTDAEGGGGARYWLEEVDLAGRAARYGPFDAARGGAPSKGARSPLVSQLVEPAHAEASQRQWTPTDADAALLTRAPRGAPLEEARARQRRLASQPAVKIYVRETGWYTVTREQLTAAGLNAAADPARLRLYAGGVEVPLHCDPAAWGEPGGALEFYGEALDVPSADTRVYWLVEGDAGAARTNEPRAPQGPAAWVGVLRPRGEPGKAGVGVIPGPPPAAAQQSFAYTAEARERAVYFSSLQNGEAENFFGRVVSSAPSAQTLTARNSFRSDAPATRLEVALQGVSTGPHRVSVLFNGSPLGAIEFAGQANRSAGFAVPSRLLREGDNEVRLVAGGAGDVSLTDRVRLTYQHALRADDDRLRFSAGAGTVRVGGFATPAVRAVDVTEPSSPSELRVSAAEPDPRGGWAVSFEVAGKGRRELYAFGGAGVSRPASVAANAPSRWSVDAGRRADLVIITHDDFARQVAPLAALRASEGLEVAVVDVEDIFDEFSYGAHTPQAVRDFLAWTRANWDKPPSYVLLVGDGSYDPRGHLGRGRYDLVPSKLVDAGSMETASDDWFADFDDDGVPEMAVGRLPVRTQAEAAAVVNKIVSRAAAAPETSALLVADRDGADGYSFEAATDTVRALLPAGASVARVNRRAQDAAAVRGQVVSGIEAGPLVVNWMGHGSVDVWTGEGLLRGADAAALRNGNRLPLFVLMTCLNGYYEGVGLDSLAESLLKAESGGAYAVWASSGMTAPAAQAEANRELYRALFAGGDPIRLGDAVRRAKAATADAEVRRTWVLFGDPSGRLR